MENLTSALSGALGNLPLSTVLSAAVTLVICLAVVHILGKLLRRLLARTRLDERIQRYALAALKLLLYIVTVVIVAESLNIPMTSLVALLSVGSLGITLAAEDILGNVAGGLVILSSRPFTIGDFVEVSGTSGTVHEISLNHTKLVTPDGHLVMLPNKELASSQMTNYTVLGRRRVVQRVTASYDAPTEAVKAALGEAVAQFPQTRSGHQRRHARHGGNHPAQKSNVAAVRCHRLDKQRQNRSHRAVTELDHHRCHKKANHQARIR